MNGKKRPNKEVKIPVKEVLVQPGQRGFGGTGLGPDTKTKHKLTSMCTTTTSLQQTRGHLVGSTTNPLGQ